MTATLTVPAGTPADPGAGPAALAPARARGRLGRLLLGPTTDPRWARPALWGLLLAAAVLYLWDLTVSGYANDFYAAAVKSGTQSVTAWLFGSLDSANAITVDKPPAAMWVMVLSARIFGFSSFSLLLPQALMGVGTVAVTHAAVKRISGHAAGLLAGALVLTVPAATLMFRFDNPDALLVLLMTVAAYCVVRAIEHSGDGTRGALRWLVWAGVALGFAFLTKMLQGLLVMPALGLGYLVAARGGLWQRIRHLLAALLAVVVSAGWFVLLVALWPSGARPYIGGSEDNSLWELAIGYNGLGRILGGEGNGGGGGGGGFGGSTGLLRMFSTEFGSFASWLLPAAVIALVAGLAFTLRLPRTDPVRASLIVWGGSLVVTALVFSFMEGTIHEYYTVALAPPTAATIAVVAVELWRGRARWWVRLPLAAMIAATGVWGFALLRRDADGWSTVLPWVVLVGSLLGAAVLVLAGDVRRIAAIAVLVGAVTALSGTTAYSVATAGQGHSGSIPSVGPAGYSAGGMGGRGGFGGVTGGTAPGGTGTTGTAPGGTGTTGTAGTGRGGLREGAAANSELAAALDATTSRWSAATIGAQSAAGYILSTDTAVMAIGGFTGSDPSITLTQFQQYVADGDIHYFLAGGGMGGGMGGRGGSGAAAEISAWVEAHYTATTIGGTTFYDLTQPTS